MAVEFKGFSLEFIDNPVGKKLAFYGFSLEFEDDSKFRLHFKGLSFEFEDDPKAKLNFKGFSLTIKTLMISSVTIQDLIGNILTFQISNAVITDTKGINNKPLTFNVDSFTANEVDFGLEGVKLDELILNFTIDYEIVAGRNVQESFQLIPN